MPKMHVDFLTCLRYCDARVLPCVSSLLELCPRMPHPANPPPSAPVAQSRLQAAARWTPGRRHAPIPSSSAGRRRAERGRPRRWPSMRAAERTPPPLPCLWLRRLSFIGSHAGGGMGAEGKDGGRLFLATFLRTNLLIFSFTPEPRKPRARRPSSPCSPLSLPFHAPNRAARMARKGTGIHTHLPVLPFDCDNLPNSLMSPPPPLICSPNSAFISGLRPRYLVSSTAAPTCLIALLFSASLGVGDVSFCNIGCYRLQWGWRAPPRQPLWVGPGFVVRVATWIGFLVLSFARPSLPLATA